MKMQNVCLRILAPVPAYKRENNYTRDLNEVAQAKKHKVPESLVAAGL